MTRELTRQFNEEVEQYRRALLYFARVCQWDEFQSRAGSLFDYVEAVEATERERRFFAVFNTILALLVAFIVIVFSIDPGDRAEWMNYKQGLFLAALAAAGFELFFFLNFRWYADMRMAGFKRRRDLFIRNIERDFRSLVKAHEGNSS